MDSRIRPIELKPIYWIPSGKTDWSMIGSSMTAWSALVACAFAFWWGVTKLAVLGWYVITHSFKPF